MGHWVDSGVPVIPPVLYLSENSNLVEEGCDYPKVHSGYEQRELF